MSEKFYNKTARIFRVTVEEVPREDTINLVAPKRASDM